MRHGRRKTTPKVKGGKVQRKNRSAVTPVYYNGDLQIPHIERRKPIPGYRHLLTKKDIEDFIRILPQWDELAIGLDRIILDEGSDDSDGWHDRGRVAINAWEKDLWVEDLYEAFFIEHRPLLKRLSVKCEQTGRDVEGPIYTCYWTEPAAKAYQLLHIFLHELGHHHDRTTTKDKRQASRGESFAEQYANHYADIIWNRYVDLFGID